VESSSQKIGAASGVAFCRKKVPGFWFLVPGWCSLGTEGWNEVQSWTMGRAWEDRLKPAEGALRSSYPQLKLGANDIWNAAEAA